MDGVAKPSWEGMTHTGITRSQSKRVFIAFGWLLSLAITGPLSQQDIEELA